jgi:drug/metabolite transporter (DMT)-like permease
MSWPLPDTAGIDAGARPDITRITSGTGFRATTLRFVEPRLDINARSRTPSLVLWLTLGGVGLSWGCTQLFSKLIVNAGHHPLGISFASTLIGAFIITVVLIVRRRRLPISQHHLVFYLICGVTGTALPNFFSYTAITHLPVGVVSIVMAAVPMTTFLAALIFGLDRAEPRRFLGLSAGIVAVLLLILPKASLPGQGQALWVLIALLPGLSYTIENIYIAKAKPDDLGALQTLCGLNWGALLAIAPLTAATDTWMDLGLSPEATLSTLAMTCFHLLAYGGFVWMISVAGPVFAAQVGYVVTLSGVALGIGFLGESHSAWVWLSLGLMLVGLALVQPRPPRA